MEKKVGVEERALFLRVIRCYVGLVAVPFKPPQTSLRCTMAGDGGKALMVEAECCRHAVVRSTPRKPPNTTAAVAHAKKRAKDPATPRVAAPAPCRSAARANACGKTHTRAPKQKCHEDEKVRAMFIEPLRAYAQNKRVRATPPPRKFSPRRRHADAACARYAR